MAKLSDLKQNAAMTKESGMVKNPEAMKTLSKEDLRKLIPEKKEEGTPGEIINNELKGIELRIYQSSEVSVFTPSPDDILHIMDKIITMNEYMTKRLGE